MSIPTFLFGRTGHMSTRTLFGAAALSRVSQAEADQTLDLLLDYGINHIDTAASYGDAELRIGPWMDRGLRDNFFLATKTENRTYQGAKEELHRSLERMRVDSVDLWQMHILVDPDEWQTAMGPNGALEAFIEAREQGLVHYLGVTGHGVTIAEMHMRSLERFDFDSVLLPYNLTMMQNPKYAAEFEALVAICEERQVAIQTIKSITKGPWGDKTQSRATWYEPLEDPAAIEAAVHWVLTRQGFFLNTVGDINILPKVLEAASHFEEGLSQETAEARLAKLGMTPLFV
jgi:aryl-alcohol dehydrogenase-like predicted oxidoreductase